MALLIITVFGSALALNVSQALAADRGPWAPNVAYAVNDTVTYNGIVYYCIQAHTSQTGWEPPNVPALWGVVGTPTPGGGATATPTKTKTNTPVPPTATRTNTPSGPTNTPTRTNTPAPPTNTPTRTNTPTGPTATPTKTNTPGTPPSATPTGSASCAVKSAPTGKVLQGYWEAWDGSSVHPGMGHIPIGQVPAGYNVINMAFPVILSDGTA